MYSKVKRFLYQYNWIITMSKKLGSSLPSLEDSRLDAVVKYFLWIIQTLVSERIGIRTSCVSVMHSPTAPTSSYKITVTITISVMQGLFWRKSKCRYLLFLLTRSTIATRAPNTSSERAAGRITRAPPSDLAPAGTGGVREPSTTEMENDRD